MKKPINDMKYINNYNINGPIVESTSIQAKIWPDILNSNCWLTKNSNRYRHYVLMYEKYFGKIPINQEHKLRHKMCICHKCDNEECCNPDHLFLGTIKENLRDMKNKKRAHGKYTEEQNLKRRGKKISELTKQNISLAIKHKFQEDPTYIKRISDSTKLGIRNDDGTLKRKYHPLSEETKKQISEKLKLKNKLLKESQKIHEA